MNNWTHTFNMDRLMTRNINWFWLFFRSVYSGVIGFGSSFLGFICQLKTIFFSRYESIDKKKSKYSIVKRIWLFLSFYLLSFVTYTITIFYGTNFIESTEKAFQIIMKNALKFFTSIYVIILTRGDGYLWKTKLQSITLKKHPRYSPIIRMGLLG